MQTESDRRLPRLLYLTLAGLTASLLIGASWGHITVFWGDYAIWLYQVQEVGRGKTVYTGVYWPQLPLAAWLFGAWTQLIGSELRHIWTLTSAIAISLALLFAEYFKTLVPERRAIWLLPLCLVVIFAAAGVNSAPLGLGMYMPAAPLAAVFLLLALLLALHVIRSPNWYLALALGAAAGAVMATKIDFWPPIGVLVVMVLMFVPARRWLVLGAMVAGGLMVALPVGAQLLTQFQLGEVWDLLMGFGQARYTGGRASPTLERVVLEVASAASVVGLCLAAVPPAHRSTRHWRWFALTVAIASISAFAWVANGPDTPPPSQRGAIWVARTARRTAGIPAGARQPRSVGAVTNRRSCRVVAMAARWLAGGKTSRVADGGGGRVCSPRATWG